MIDFAALAIKVDSTDVRKATSDIDRLTRHGAQAERATARIGRSLKGAFAGVAIGTTITAGLVSIYRATIEAEESLAQLDARIKSTAGSAGLTTPELAKMASGLQAVTKYSDDAVMQSQAMLLTFTKVGREVFPQATETALNMATALGTDLKSATLQLGKALNDPVLGVSALSRAGVQFTKSQKDVIKTMVETGNVIGAQKLILAELEMQMGGAARASRDTLGGAIQGLMNDFGDLLEGKSGGAGVKGATGAINDLAEQMRSQEMQQGFQTIVQGVFSIMEMVAKAIPKIIEFNAHLGEMGGMTSGPDGSRAGHGVDAVKGFMGKLAAAQEIWLGFATGDEARRLAGHAAFKDAHTQGLAGVGLIDRFIPAEVRDARAAAGRVGGGGMGMEYDPTGGKDAQRARQMREARAEAARVAAEEAKAGAGKGAAEKAAAEAARAAEARARDFQNLQAHLRTEQEAIEASYAERKRIIEGSTQEGSELRDQLTQRNNALREEELAALNEQQMREVESLRQSLLTQEEAIEESYSRRMQIINEAMGLSESQRQTLRDKVNEERERDLQAIADAKEREREMVWQGLMTEEEMMLAYHERKRDEILKATLETEQERQELLRREEERFMQESVARERERLNLVVGTAGDLFGSLSQLFGQLAQAGGKEGKKAFEMSKKLAIAQTLMKTYESATSAYASLAGIPYVGPALGAAAAAAAVVAGMANIAQIRGQQYSGAYDQGGYIPANKWGWAGEYGPERVRGPAVVQSRTSSRRHLTEGNGGQISVGVTVNMGEGTTAVSTSQRGGGASADDERMARDLGVLVGNKVQEELLLQQRPGGILHSMQTRR